MIKIIQKDKKQESAELLSGKEGLVFLKKLLSKDWYDPIPDKNKLYDSDHEHLSSKDWGGNELTPEFTSPNAERINSLKVIYLGEHAEKILS